MMTKAATFFTALASLAGLGMALPNGAPGCNVMAVAKMTDGENLSQDLGFTMTLSAAAYAPGDTIDVTIENSQDNAVVGLLLYAEAANDPEARIGEWVGFNEDNWQPANCPDQCPDGVCGLTHTSDDEKPAPVTLSVSLPEDMGDLVMKAVVALNANTYQILADVPLTGPGGEDLAENIPDLAVDNVDGQCQCVPVKKCKKWKTGAFGTSGLGSAHHVAVPFHH